jgi:hypothetical protein
MTRRSGDDDDCRSEHVVSRDGRLVAKNVLEDHEAGDARADDAERESAP